MRYEVIVGNLGSVYAGDDEFTAWHTFNVYQLYSQRHEGRAAGESVTLMCDGEPIKEHPGDPS
jgi:hypothetical protein